MTIEVFAWPDGRAEQLQRHDVPPAPEFLEHITRYGFRCPPVTAWTVDAAAEALRKRSA